MVTLKQVAAHFAYHPNYISGLLRKQTGRSFSEILLDLRMRRAALLLQNSTLSVEEIAELLGYRDKSNFHKAFRTHFGCTPREYLARESPLQHRISQCFRGVRNIG